MPKKLSSVRAGQRLEKVRRLAKLSKKELVSLVNQALDPKHNRPILNEKDITDIEQGRYLINHLNFECNIHRNNVYKNIVKVLRRYGLVAIYLDYILHGKLAKIDSFCLRLWELRTRKGMTQKDIVLATNNNISQGQLAKYENSVKYPSPDAQKLIADALGLTVYQLTNQLTDQTEADDIQFKELNNDGSVLLSNGTSLNLPEQLKLLFQSLPKDKVTSLINQLDNITVKTNEGIKIQVTCKLLNNALFD